MRLQKTFFQGLVSKAEIATPFGAMTAVFSQTGVRGLLWPEDLRCESTSRSIALLPTEKTTRVQILKAELDLFPKHRRSENSVPVDATGSDFQKKVWQGLQKIKVGTTRSYSEFTLDLGFSKNSTRAVASAIAKNPLSILWPCHRVIAKDGSLGGFAGGLRAKKNLLDCETTQKEHIA